MAGFLSLSSLNSMDSFIVWRCFANGLGEFCSDQRQGSIINWWNNFNFGMSFVQIWVFEQWRINQCVPCERAIADFNQVFPIEFQVDLLISVESARGNHRHCNAPLLFYFISFYFSIFWSAVVRWKMRNGRIHVNLLVSICWSMFSQFPGNSRRCFGFDGYQYWRA